MGAPCASVFSAPSPFDNSTSRELKRRVFSKQAILRKRLERQLPVLPGGEGHGGVGCRASLGAGLLAPQAVTLTNICSHPERKSGGRTPPKEACQVNETIKRQGKTSWFRGGRGERSRGRGVRKSWACYRGMCRANIMRCGPGL